MQHFLIPRLSPIPQDTPRPEQGTSKVGLPFKFAPLLIPLLLFFSGCASKERYTYEQIRAEYTVKKPESRADAGQPDRPGEISVPSPLPLKEAVRIALRNNPDMDMAIARIRQSEAMIDEAMAAFWPFISVYGEYLQGDAPSAYLFKTIDQRMLPPDVDFNYPGWFESYEIGGRVRWNLFNGGRDLLRKKIAETGLAMSELDRLSVENALVASVLVSYYNVLVAQEAIKIAQESVITVETELRIMRVRYKDGAVLKSDILSLEVRLAQAREELVRSENNESRTIAALANLLGLDPDTSLTLFGDDKVSASLPDDYQSGLVYALAKRPELEKVRRQIIQSRMALDAARAEYLPTLDAQLHYYLDDPSLDFDTDRENWTAGFILKWDLFSGFGTKARADRAQRVLEEMLAADRKTILSVQLDLKTAYLRLAEAEARLRVTEASVAQAEESFSLVKKQYEGGSVTITRYLEAELARNRARLRSIVAFYDKEKAAAEIGRAMGYWIKYARGVLDDSKDED